MNKKNMHQFMSTIFQKLNQKLIFCFAYLLPCAAFAEDDPMSKAGQSFHSILFGALGTTVCAIIIGSTFILAKVGKVSWDKFLFIGFCTAGFIGTPTIIKIIQSAVR